MPAVNEAQEIRKAVDRLVASATSSQDLMSALVKLLRESVPKYDWVGFYMLEPAAKPPILVLGPYQGAATPHTRIPLDQGICGAAASSGQTVVVDDVTSDSRYLACSIETKSEIVVPIRARGEIVGELDIDSHSIGAFRAEDRELIEYCAWRVGSFIEDLG